MMTSKCSFIEHGSGKGWEPYKGSARELTENLRLPSISPMQEPFANLSPEQQKQISFVASLLLAEGFVREGYLDLPNVSDVELSAQINSLVKSKFIQGEETLSLTFDHTDKLLELAKQFESQSDLELTCLFYTLCIEHRLNRIARTLFRRRGIPDKDAVQIVRKLAVRDKATWLFKFFNLEEPPGDLLVRLGVIEEYRNSFVHFKWVALYEREDEVWRAVNQVGEIFDWLEMIDDKYIFHGQKARLKSACEKIVEEEAAT